MGNVKITETEIERITYVISTLLELHKDTLIETNDLVVLDIVKSCITVLNCFDDYTKELPKHMVTESSNLVDSLNEYIN
jgi:hypothetical protein